MEDMLKRTSKQDRLADHFKSLILSGKYKSGDLIPPETAIAKEYGVNRGTVGKALAFLASSGILVRKQGCGTFVSENLNEGSLRIEQAKQSNGSNAACSSIAIITFLRTDDPHYPNNPQTQVFFGIEDSIPRFAKNCKVSFTNLFPESKIDGKLLNSLKKAGTSGIIYHAAFPEDIPPNIFELKNCGIPFVMACTVPCFSDVDMVSLSQYCIGFAAASHLIGKGHRNIIYVGNVLDSFWLDQRIEGFRDAVIAGGLKFSEKMIFRYGKELGRLPKEGRKEGAEAAEILLETMKDCTGIAAVNDAYAVGIIGKLRQKGIDVPGKISVVGTDDEFYFRNMDITTVKIPLREIGETAVEILLRKISNENERRCCEKRFVKPMLIERSTTARVKG